MNVFRPLLTPSRVVVVGGALLAALLSTSTPTSAAQVIEHDYVGAERCKSCHEAEYAAWEKDPHAQAFEVLSPAEKRDPRCLSCHTAVPSDTSAALVGVQCESCHGAGRHYTPDYVMRDAELASALGLIAKVDATSCTRCHNDTVPALQPFDFAAKRPLIKHWKD